MTKERLLELINNYLNETLTDSEKNELIAALEVETYAAIAKERIHDAIVINEFSYEPNLEKLYTKIALEVKNIPATKIKKMHMVRWLSVAAVVFALVTGSIIWLQKYNSEAVITSKVIKDVAPGKLGAILRLDNSKTIVLDTAKNGLVASGFYKKDSTLKIESAIAQNATVTTPLGRLQRLELSDGTIVWLNAGSSITFPTIFKGNTRVVSITGEAYFEVAHNAKHPFIVKAGNDDIKVLGTHFNVNAYDNGTHAITTLLQGSVQINQSITLKPGQQFENDKVFDVNTESRVAWVYGYFYFERADIYTIMQQISRWYDVDVEFKGKQTKELFGGEMQRDLNLSQVLKLIEKIGIHYTLNGKKLIIQN